MEQIDLFNCPSDCNSESDFNPIDGAKTPVEKPVKKKPTGKRHIPVNKKTINYKSQLMCLVHEFAEEIWPDASEEHRKRSIMQAALFDEYRDNSQLKLTEIRGLVIKRYTQHMTKKGQKATTINRHLSTLSRILDFAEEAEMILEAPRLKRRKEGEGRIRVYTLDRIREMIAYCKDKGDDWMADMITVASLTGMRRGEILQIGRTAYVNENDQLYLPHTKSGHERLVDLSPDALSAVRRLEQGVDHFTHRKFYRRWTAMKKSLNMAQDDCFHVIRHTVASILANTVKENAFVIQDQLGHQNIETTKKYVHTNADAKKQAVTKLADVIQL